MKAVVNREGFAEALKKAGRALNLKTIGTLNGYHISLRKNGDSYVTGISAMCRIRALFSASTDEDFEMAVTQEVADVVQRLSGTRITITESDGKLLMRSGKTSIKTPVLDCVQPDYPSAYGIGGIETDSLSMAVRGIQHALASEDAANKLMSSVNLDIGEDGIKAEALDGCRISIRGWTGVEKTDALIHGAAMKIVAALFPETVRIECTKDVVTFSDSMTIVDCTQTDGVYFNTGKMLSAARVSACITLNRRELVHAVELVTVMSPEKEIREVWITIREHSITLSTDSQKGGVETDVDASVSLISSQAQAPILLSGRYLLDSLKSVEEDEVSFEITSNKGPVLMKGDGYTELILPRNPVKK